MKRPMRLYRRETVACRDCGDHIRATDYGWVHDKPIKITDPAWHVARP